jgi:hypothetical protein
MVSVLTTTLELTLPQTFARITADLMEHKSALEFTSGMVKEFSVLDKWELYRVAVVTR